MSGDAAIEDLLEVDTHRESRPKSMDLAPPSRLDSWTAPFLASQSQSTAATDDADSGIGREWSEKKRDEFALPLITVSRAPAVASSVLNRSSARTHSSITHSEHLRPFQQPSNQGVSLSQPLPDDDFYGGDNDNASESSEQSTQPESPSNEAVVDSVMTTEADTSSDSASDCADDSEQPVSLPMSATKLASLRHRLNQLAPTPAYNYSYYHFLLGLIQTRMGDFASALESFKHADRQFTPVIDDPNEPRSESSYRTNIRANIARTIVDSAIDAARSGAIDSSSQLRAAFDEARTILATLQANDGGTNPRLWNDLCILLLKAGDLNSAIDLYGIVSHQFPNVLQFQSNLAACLLIADNNSEEAAGLLMTLLTQQPTYLSALVNYANILSSSGRHQQAIRVLLIALDVDDHRVDAWTNLGVEYQMIGDLERATIAFDTAHSLKLSVDPTVSQPSTMTLRFNLANHLVSRARNETNAEMRANQLRTAKSFLLQLQESEPSSSSLKCSLGDCEFVSGNLNEAEKYYLEALELNSINFDAANNLGLLYLQTKQFAQSERYLKTALSLIAAIDANIATVLNNLATAVMNQQRFNEAKSAAECALRVAERHLSQHDNSANQSLLAMQCTTLTVLGTNARLMGDLKQARDHYGRCLTVLPAFTAALNGLALVEIAEQHFDAAQSLLQRVVNNARSPIEEQVARHNSQRMERLLQQQ